ncbi:MAG TPA: YoaK family protein [Agitococcus sp.]|nr:YoaK family protein [Agitococcus sp.]HNG10108.1 YoaK family protein [Agitococcus sp.]HNG46587.1 YoaK family protein [Agitococcus sp.]HNL36495.1 YoaK family protein [Agitococcus sp.]HNL80636.1 YoaK family protein [Agitococcus sp.]
MTQKLPAWIEIGAFILALIAGLINVVGLLGFQHQSVSHLTGTVSLFSLKIVQGEWLAVQHFMGVMLCFFLGAMLSGLIIQNATLKLGRRYSVALFIESLLLIFALIMLQGNYSAGDFWASAACGLQNAMISTYSGAVIRTTHVTGTVTDLGALIGQYLRGHSIDKRKIGLYLILLGGFIAGGLIGAYGFLHYSYYVLLMPILATQTLAVLYAWYWYQQQKT